MQIEHLAIWVNNLDLMKTFYEKYFEGKSNEMYHNTKRGFKSYFLEFKGGTRIELMNIAELNAKQENTHRLQAGLAHIAFSTGSKEAVDELTEVFRNDGYEVIGNPRVTGDGYYESTIHDPENNIIELTI